MKRESWIAFMNLLDETFIAEADPANAKRIRQRKRRAAVMRRGAAACICLLLGIVLILPFFPRSEDPFTAQIKTIPVTDTPLYVSFASLDDMIESTHANLIIRCTVTERLNCVVYDPWMKYSESDLKADEQTSAAAQRCLATPYRMTVNDCYLGGLTKGDKLTFYAPYGILEEYASRRADIPIFDVGGDYILILRAEMINNMLVYALAYTPDSIYVVDMPSSEQTDSIPETSLFYPYLGNVSALETALRTLVSEHAYEIEIKEYSTTKHAP